MPDKKLTDPQKDPQAQAPAAPGPQLGPAPTVPGAPPAAPENPGHPGPEVAYFAFKLDGPGGKPVGLFRLADDSEAEVLTMERFDPSGEWVDDPTLIDDLHEPGVYSVDEHEAQSIEADISGAKPAAPAPA